MPNLSRLRADTVAGITTACVVLPQAVAYATIAGLPVQAGLYCALVPMIAYALLGTSRPLSVSTTSTLSALTAAALAATPPGTAPMTAASTLAVLTGVILLAASVLRLGFLGDFISDPVMTGLKSGIGLTIAAGQLGTVIGVHAEGTKVFDRLLSAAGRLGEANVPTMLVAAGVILLLVVLRRLPHVPGPLVAVTVVTLISFLAHLSSYGVATIGRVPSGLPPPLLPDLGLVRTLAPMALGMALLAFVESISAARIFRHRDDPPLDADRELLALGLANALGGIFRAYPAAGGMTQSEMNDASGARSQRAEIVTALCTAVVLLLLAPALAPLPTAVLGGIVLTIAARLVDVHGLAAIWRASRPEFALACVTMLVAVGLGIMQSVLAAVVISILLLLHQVDNPPIYPLGRDPESGAYRDLRRHPSDETEPGLLIVRIESRLYFANARRVADRVRALIEATTPLPRAVLLDLTGVPGMDLTSVSAAKEFYGLVRQHGIDLWIALDSLQPLELLGRMGIGGWLSDRGRLHPDVKAAVAAYRARGS
ncbi:SulP family inorganic anion transporter [Streptosporangium amethystogenes]|uniref:SulP family inorganic anion transporter n=1 Tax=Streptosporangium amethystogenes TaxID=2002 RepID=UPI0004CA148C|nr:SulP family inorganic anion transporter [Streptosporangium amethystogenes]